MAMPLVLGPFPKECLSLEPGKDFAGGFHSKRIFPGVGSIPSSSLALPVILVSDFATFLDSIKWFGTHTRSRILHCQSCQQSIESQSGQTRVIWTKPNLK